MKFLHTRDNDFIPLNAITKIGHDGASPTPLCWIKFGVEYGARSVRVPAETLANEIVLFAKENDEADFLHLDVLEENYQASLDAGPELVEETEPVDEPPEPGPKFPTPESTE